MLIRGLVTIAIAAALLLPGRGYATTYQDQLGNCSYPKTFDLVFMRPIGLSMLAVGAGMFAVVGPWTLLVAPGEIGEPLGTFVTNPVNFVFRRPLGLCAQSAVGL